MDMAHGMICPHVASSFPTCDPHLASSALTCKWYAHMWPHLPSPTGEAEALRSQMGMVRGDLQQELTDLARCGVCGGGAAHLTRCTN